MSPRQAVSSRPICRRIFLQGAGGVSVGLPLLPSLATRKAFAADPIIPRQRFFYVINTEHGACQESNMYPKQSTLTEKSIYDSTGQTIRWGKLTGTANGTKVSLSPALTADSATLTPSLMSKVNVLRGLDTAIHIGHQRGGSLGAFHDNNAGNGGGIDKRPTLDQVMAWAPSFYKSPASVRMRSMAYGPSWGYSNAETFSGTIQKISTNLSSRDLFDKIFVKPGTTPVATRKPIVDRVLENYRSLRNGNRRISATDRQRLDDHMSHLNQVQKSVQAAPSLMCGDQTRPTEVQNAFFGNLPKYASLIHDVFAVAFSCGSSAVASLSMYPFRAAGYNGDWHQSVAHQAFNANNQGLITKFLSSVFQDVLLNFAKKLDSIAGSPGRTLLDDSLLMWTQEAGQETHWQVSIPVITVGSGGGFLNTGRFVDYRDMNSKVGHYTMSRGAEGRATLPDPDDQNRYHGILYNQFLATALQAVGVPPKEFELWGHKGFGNTGHGSGELRAYDSTRNYYSQYGGKYFNIASDPLPVIGA